MQANVIKPRKALNAAWLKVKPIRSEIETFKANLIHLIHSIDNARDEEYHKTEVRDFLRNTYYKDQFHFNVKHNIDWAIFNGPKSSDSVGVLIETKKPANKSEMLTRDNINKKAFHELILYYLRERITHKNLEIKHIVATNIYEWFIFDAAVFDRLFAQSKSLVKQFTDFEEGRLAGKTTDFFYREIAEPFVAQILTKIEYTWFDIRDYEKPLKNQDKRDDNQLIVLYKILSPEHLLKLRFVNDSNSLDKAFYAELLHLIGLSETKEGNKKVIGRKPEGKRDDGSLLENAIVQLDSMDKISRMAQPSQYGANYEERLFNVALELVITWVNRILFLKLLEAQLVSYHHNDPSFSFLNFKKVRNYDDLNSLFFSVLARTPESRIDNVKARFAHVPYLNSSLFELSDIEAQTIVISNLGDEVTLPLLSATVLKDNSGKRRSGAMNALEYFFEFLEAYDFSSEGSEEIQEDNKSLINASVLGLIFEKINGYKDGSFFTPGFITMYMCREAIRRAVVERFNESSPQNSSPLSAEQAGQTPLQKGEGLPSVPGSGDGTPNVGTEHGSTNPPLRHGEGVARRAGGEDTPEFSSPLSTEQAGQTPLQKGEGPSSVPESSAGTPNTGTAHGSTTPPLRHGEGVVRRTGGEDEKARTVHTQLPPELLRNARELRKSMTDPEALLWQLLRNRRLNRWKFRRQHPMKEGYILDFYCAETRVAIELDGEYHKEALQKEYDEQRTVVLDQYGIRVIRFWNSEVLTNPEDVLRRIVEFSSLQNSSPQTPLQKGEGLPSVPESGAGTPNTGTSHGSTTPPLRFGEGVADRPGVRKKYSSLHDIYEAIGTDFSKKQANQIINSLKICDPAVGSGHFLVSALNEIIAIKSELKILMDRTGRTLRDYHIQVENDELAIRDDDGNLFKYSPESPESQRVQEALFHEKQIIIENCLFGVDINPNSVKICRLRLWIELLKHAYYVQEDTLKVKSPVCYAESAELREGYELPVIGQLQTLPNIDINIKCGNSLISRFELDAGISQALKKSKWTIDSYRTAVQTYREASNKEEKREMERLIADIKKDFETEISKNDKRLTRLNKIKGELFNLTNQQSLFGMSDPEKKAWEKQVEKLTKDAQKLEAEIEEIKSNKMYENAFEWRFEFPEVLDEEGNFVGFDVVIGNPPYIRQEEFSSSKPYLQSQYETYAGTADLFVYFVERGLMIAKTGAQFVYILPNKWMRAGYGLNLRKWIKNYEIISIVDFGDLPVFEEATTYPCLWFIRKQPAKAGLFASAQISTLQFPNGLDRHVSENIVAVDQNLLPDSGWTLVDDKVQKLLEKIKNAGVPLGEYVKGKIFYGIKTGFNEAFVIDAATRERLIREDPKCEEIIKPFLAGRDIKRYQQPKSDKYLILLKNGQTKEMFGELNEEMAWDKLVEKYPSIAKHLALFTAKAKARYDQGQYWWELRACDYYDEFESRKIMYPDISKNLNFTIDEDKHYCVNTVYNIATGAEALLGYLNSQLFLFYFSSVSNSIRGGYMRFFSDYMLLCPVPKDLGSIETTVNKVLLLKRQNPDADTSQLEADIDRMVYELYGLTEEEIALVENR